MDLTVLFLFFSTICLLPLAYQDLATRKADERASSFMLGVVSLISILNGLAWVFVLLMLVVILVLPRLKIIIRNKIGAGDLSVLSWLVPGIAVTNFLLLPVFFFGFAGIMLIARFKQVERAPLVAFMFVSLLLCFGLQIMGLGAYF